MEKITKNSFISISLVIVLLVGTFWLGTSYANISTRVNIMEKKLDKIEIKIDNLKDKL